MTVKIISQISIWIQTRYISVFEITIWMQGAFSLKKTYLSIVSIVLCYMLCLNTGPYIQYTFTSDFYSAVYFNSNSHHFHNNSHKILQWIGDEDNKKSNSAVINLNIIDPNFKWMSDCFEYRLKHTNTSTFFSNAYHFVSGERSFYKTWNVKAMPLKRC